VPGRSIRVARIAGIPVGVSPLWLIIVALITWSLGAGYYPSEVHGIEPFTSYALGLASALLLFASILAHEFGHALVARRRGVEIEEIDLWLLGGVARMSGRPQSANDELSFALAGPAVTAVVAAVFGALALVLPSSAPAALRAVVRYQAEVNFLILGFNLVPAFPLDGGRAARALLWRRTGNIAQATDTAAGLGRAFGYLLIGGGILLWLDGSPGGLWFAVIGGFLIAAAGAERVQEQVVALLTGVHVSDLMSQPAITIPAELTLAEAQQYFARHRFTAFPITDQTGRAVGLLSIDQLEKAPQSAWSTITSGKLAERDPELILREEMHVAQLLERPTFARVGRATVVDGAGRPIGLISLTDVQRAIRASRLRHPPAGTSNAAHSA
jgi:Zn-dependent protease/CBS domain-containing protein